MEEISPEDAAGALASDHVAWPLCPRIDTGGGIYVTPRIPDNAIGSALLAYLDLASDEVLLSLVTAGDRANSPRCALTTKRIYWAGDARVPGSEWRDPDRPSTSEDVAPPPKCQYLDYRDLPETIKPLRVVSSGIDLGEGRTIRVGSQKVANALIDYLTTVRKIVKGEAAPAELSPMAEMQRVGDWRSVLARDTAARAIQEQLRLFRSRTTAANRGLVTYALAAICILVYVAMVVSGVTPFLPSPKVLYSWGANLGLAVVFEDQRWRLLTCIFLHFGIIHLGMNMWCLLSVGPVVERFFGHLGFAALYLIAGLGGAIASLAVHPTVVSAGASGAIFGMFGGLLAFLAVRRSDVPASVLKPMRSSVLGFLGYNVVFGMMMPNIDMSAHLGGLVTGFVAGLFLAPAKTTQSGGTGLIRKGIAIAGLSIALILGAHQAIGIAGRTLRDNPKFASMLPENRAAGESWNAFNDALTPILMEFDRITSGLNGIIAQFEKGGYQIAEVQKSLKDLSHSAVSLETSINRLPVKNDEIRAMAGNLSTAKGHLSHIIEITDQFLANGDEAVLMGPKGVQNSFTAYAAELKQFGLKRDAYFSAHGLTMVPK